MRDDRRGIVHIIGPELGLTQPGKTIVCGDSHTSTHGAFGALAFGIGTTEVGHVLATQCLLQRRPRTMAVEVAGKLGPGVTAKDLMLAIIGRIGVNGGTGHVIEYRGPAIEALSMDERMTVCNMSIEAGARAGMIAPDETTFAYLRGRPRAPSGDAWERAVADWRTLRTDPDARFDRRSSRCRRCGRADDHATAPIPAWSSPISGCVPDRPGDAVHREVARLHGPARPASGCATSRSRSCSSAAAPTRGCPIWSWRRRCSPAAGRARCARAGRAGLAADQARGRGARPRQDVHRRRRRVARIRLLDVHRA